MIHTSSIEQSYDALRQAAYVIETSDMVGESKRLSYDVYDEMDDSRRLFASIGVRYSYRVTKTQEVYFSLMKEPAQEFAIQRANILRFHKDAKGIGKYVMLTRLTNELSEKSYLELLDLVESFRVTFGLDANNIPISVNMDNCPMKEFQRHWLLKYVFVENMEEFWVTPAPRSSRVANYGLRAKSKEFKNKIYTPNIMFAY